MPPVNAALQQESVECFLRRLPCLLILLLFAAMFVLFPDQAYASTSGAGLEWESPLQKFGDSIKGPVAFVISLLGIVVCGAMLIWGGEINEFVRRFVMVILVISLLVFATSILTSLFGIGAIIDLPEVQVSEQVKDAPRVSPGSTFYE
jgi:type IV secretory pathway VirB2 component (pilin)